MSQKQDKKMRKMFRKQYLATANLLAEEHMKILKPKPEWFPMWLYIKILGIFIRINK